MNFLEAVLEKTDLDNLEELSDKDLEVIYREVSCGLENLSLEITFEINQEKISLLKNLGGI